MKAQFAAEYITARDKHPKTPPKKTTTRPDSKRIGPTRYWLAADSHGGGCTDRGYSTGGEREKRVFRRIRQSG